jgi:predicted dithiol-disulfide oxidoreductase (DUF899 family)
MVEIDKDYVFTGPVGQARLADLFDGRRQLIVYHFMWRHEATLERDHFRIRSGGRARGERLPA